jgi:uncharacterized protein
MKTIAKRVPLETVVISLAPGELLLESIQAAARKHKIQNGVIVSGIGTLKQCRIYAITGTGFPPGHDYFTIKRPLELISVSGIIADGQAHIHVAVSCGKNELYSGHLEEGSEVAYLAEIAILKCNALRMKRRLDRKRQISLLGPA